MKWIILGLVVLAVVLWLSRRKRYRGVSDPEAKTVEKQDYYVSPDDRSVRDDPADRDR